MYFNTAETANDPEVNARLGISQDFTEPLLSAPYIKITGEGACCLTLLKFLSCGRAQGTSVEYENTSMDTAYFYRVYHERAALVTNLLRRKSCPETAAARLFFVPVLFIISK